MIKAKYTVVLKALMDNAEAKAAIDKALSAYPLYQPVKHYDMIPNREEVNRRLLNHYKYHEIGFETFGRFLDELEITMGEIMPRYNELLKTIEIMAELPSPFDNVDVVETFEETRTGRSSSEGTTTGKSSSEGTTTDNTSGTATDSTTTKNDVESYHKGVESGTPQDELSVPANNIDSVGYADKVNWDKDNSSADGTSTRNSTTGSNSSGTSKTESDSTGTSKTATDSSDTTKHTYTKKGNQGVNTYAHDMNEFRTSIIDVIDQMIQDPRIRELFMLVY